MVALLTVTLGSRIRQARSNRRLTQAAFGLKIGLSDSYISQIETGQKTPTYETLQVICDALGLDFREMAALAADLPPADDEPDIDDPELDLLFQQAKRKLSDRDKRALKMQFRVALEMADEEGE